MLRCWCRRYKSLLLLLILLSKPFYHIVREIDFSNPFVWKIVKSHFLNAFEKSWYFVGAKRLCLCVFVYLFDSLTWILAIFELDKMTPTLVLAKRRTKKTWTSMKPSILKVLLKMIFSHQFTKLLVD